MTRLRSALVVATAIVSLAACDTGSSSTPAPTQTTPGPSVSVDRTTVPANGQIVLAFRNTTDREVTSGTWCVDGGYQQLVGGTWQNIGRTPPQACSLPVLIWAPGQTRTETINLAQWGPQVTGSGPWTVRVTFNISDRSQSGVVTSDQFTITAP